MTRPVGLSFTSEVRDETQWVTLSGELTTADGTREFAEDVRKAIAEAARDRVLVDVSRLRGRVRPAETYFLVRGEPRSSRAGRVAIVDLDEDRDADGFLETAARNAGYVIKRFTGTTEALAWLSDPAVPAAERS